MQKELIDYLSSIELNKSQKEGLMQVISNPRKDILITGQAGTGKTYLLNIIINCLKIINPTSNILSTAPTHQAKKVLSQSINQIAMTIHSAFKIHPVTYEDIVEFNQGGEIKLNEYTDLVIDEAGMCDDTLYQIVQVNKPIRLRIIAVGDPNQLQPVDNIPGQLSKFFTETDHVIHIKLTEIVRQSKNSPIIIVANDIIHGKPLYPLVDGNTGVANVSNLQSLLKHYLKFVKNTEDTLNYRIFAYTNDMVNKINRKLHQIIYKTDEPFVLGEYLVMQQPLIIKIGEEIEKVFDNGEIVEINRFVKNKETFYIPYIDDPVYVEYYDLYVTSVDEGTQNQLKVIYDETSLNQLSYAMHCSAQIMKQKKIKDKYINLKRDWQTWWLIKNLFQDVKNIFCSTIHKSQGITVEGTFLYTQDMDYADPIIKKQLLYVGVTRAKRFVIFH